VKLSAAIVGVAVVVVPAVASAWPQQRDYFLDPPRAGTFVHADLFTAGVQATLEKRMALEDESLSMLHLRANAMASIGYADLGLQSDLRFGGLFTIGGGMGYRRVWNNFSPPPDIANTRERRHDKDEPRGDKAVNWPWFELRARMVIPLESLWLVANAASRWEGTVGDSMPENAYDWFHTNVHDPGQITRLDATLFYRNKHFGGLGPTIRYMNMPRAGERVTEVVYGLTFGTRPGFFRKDDLLLVQTLFDFKDTKKEFGWHTGPLEKIPAYIMIIYRKSFQL
jgi:hypothetical protein